MAFQSIDQRSKAVKIDAIDVSYPLIFKYFDGLHESRGEYVHLSKSKKTPGNTKKLRLVLGSKPKKTPENATFLIFFVALLPRIKALALKPCICHR